MSLSDLAAIGGFVSGVAVLITLLFLMAQLRQTNRNQHALMRQGRTARYIEIISSRTQPHLGESFSLAMDSASLDVAQFAAVTAHIDAYFWHFEDCYLQYHAGTIDEASWNSDVATLTFLMALAPFRARWRTVRALSHGEYRDYVDSLLQRVPCAKPDTGLRSRWEALVAEEIAAAS